MDGAGARAGAGDHRDLRYNAGDPGDLRRQRRSGLEQFKTAVQFGAGSIVERHNGRAGLCGHFQHMDLPFNVLHRDGFAVFIYGVDALPVRAAVCRADGALRVQRHGTAVIEKGCKDLCLAGFVCCHTATS